MTAENSARFNEIEPCLQRLAGFAADDRRVGG